MRESSIRKALKAGVEKAGGLCEAMERRGARHFPDDLVTWPGGVMELVEEKRPGQKPRAGQLRDHARRAKHGVKVHVISTLEEVEKYLRRGNP